MPNPNADTVEMFLSSRRFHIYSPGPDPKISKDVRKSNFSSSPPSPALRRGRTPPCVFGQWYELISAKLLRPASPFIHPASCLDRVADANSCVGPLSSLIGEPTLAFLICTHPTPLELALSLVIFGLMSYERFTARFTDSP